MNCWWNGLGNETRILLELSKSKEESMISTRRWILLMAAASVLDP